MAVVAAAVGSHRSQARGIAGIAHVVDEGPRAVECGWTHVGIVPAHGIAGGVAHAAVDALDGLAGRAAFRTFRTDDGQCIGARLRRHEAAMRPLPLLEERRHVGGEILDDGEIGKRPDLELAAAGHLGDVRAAGPAWHAVDGHGAGAAHADAAGETVGERRIGVALDPGDDVENGLARLQRDREGLVTACILAAPDRDLDRVAWRRAHRTVTCRRCTMLLPKPPRSKGASKGCVAPSAPVARQASSCSPFVAFHTNCQPRQA